VVLHDLVVEDREVQGEAELDGVAWGKLNLASHLVVLESLVADCCDLRVTGVLCDVAVVVADHLDEECFAFTFARLGEHLSVNHVDNLLAIVVQLAFNLLLVSSEGVAVFLVLGVRLDCGDRAASSALRANHVLESD